jgi:hypothetical protein
MELWNYARDRALHSLVCSDGIESRAARRVRLEVRKDPDERVQDFAKWYIEDLERMRDAERKRAEGMWRYANSATVKNSRSQLYLEPLPHVIIQ